MTPANDPAVDPEQDVMTAEEAAAYLRLELKTLYDSCAQGIVPHRRVSKRRIRFSREALRQWLRTTEEKKS